MSEFKVGDKVVAISANTHGWGQVEAGDVGEVKEASSSMIVVDFEKQKDWKAREEDLKLYVPKRTKNQRITSLEERVEQQQNEINELKVIVHRLHENGLPSTIKSVEDELEIIEFEDAKYRKVDRLAREGDVVILNDVGSSDAFDTGKPYKVFAGGLMKGERGHGTFGVYKEFHNRTPETVDVYELIVEDKQPPLLTVAGETRETTHEEIAQLISEPSPNELRAEIIEKAKKFVEQVIDRGLDEDARASDFGNETYRCHYYEVDFVTKENKVTALVTLANWKGEKLSANPEHVARAKCNPSDVFNEHIGRAIALGRALGLDVSEFEQAVQPTMAVGQVVHYKSPVMRDFEDTTEIAGFYEDGNPLAINLGGVMDSRGITIINDTNAIYSEVK